MLDVLRESAGAGRRELAEGVYLAVAGPSFETPAEIRAYRTMGADAVGTSSTVAGRLVLARHCGLRVAAVSVITNLAEGMSDEPLSHEQTLRAAQDGAGDLTRLLLEFLARCDTARGSFPAKRDGLELSADEITQVCPGSPTGSVTDAQVGAMAMAIVSRGMSAGERVRADRRDDPLGRRTRLELRRVCPDPSSISTRPVAWATR